jgi:ankyrin repeat protein
MFQPNNTPPEVREELDNEYLKKSKDLKSKNKALFEILDLPNRVGHTPFTVAVIKGYLKIAKLLLYLNMSDIDYKDKQEDTPLHWAIILRNYRAVYFLLENGASIEHNNKMDNKAIMLATIHDVHEDFLGLLLKDWTSDKQRRHYLVCHEEKIRKNITTVNKKGMTALHAACINGNKVHLDILVRAKGELKSTDIKQMMPVHYAVVLDHAQILQNMHLNRDLYGGFEITGKEFNCQN